MTSSSRVNVDRAIQYLASDPRPKPALGQLRFNIGKDLHALIRNNFIITYILRCGGVTVEAIQPVRTVQPFTTTLSTENGIAVRMLEKGKNVVDAVVNEVQFGSRAVVNGIAEDWREGGLLGFVIGATGGPTEQKLIEQILTDYQRTSLVVGPVKDLDKTATSLAMGGAITRRYGGYSFAQLAFQGPAPHLGTYTATARLAAQTTAINAVVITSAFEAGNLTGSFLRAGINRSLRGLQSFLRGTQ